jgi:hypothetical protein
MTKSMFPPRSEFEDAFCVQSGIGQPESESLTIDSPKPLDGLDLAQLRFVRCLVRWGLTLDEASAVVSSELERLRPDAKTQRRRLAPVGMRLVPGRSEGGAHG